MRTLGVAFDSKSFKVDHDSVAGPHADVPIANLRRLPLARSVVITRKIRTGYDAVVQAAHVAPAVPKNGLGRFESVSGLKTAGDPLRIGV